MPRADSATTFIRRKHTMRDRDRQLQIVGKIGTFTARAMFAAVDARPVLDFQCQLALVCMAHHVDVLTAAGEDPITYPEDVAEIMGCTPGHAGAKLRLVKATGLIAGSAQAGYRLAGAMVSDGPGEDRRGRRS